MQNKNNDWCPGCDKSDCEAPPLVKGYTGNGCGFDQSSFEDDCAGQAEVRGRPARQPDHSLPESYGGSRINPFGFLSDDEKHYG